MSKMIHMASSGYQMSDHSLCETILDSGLPILPVPRKKIHCILPSSPWLADSKTNIPLGVLYIAGLLREQGHEVVVTSMLDKRYEGNIHLPDAVMDADVHMFGFCTPQFGEALELADYIRRRNPDALLVAGGPHPSYEPVETKTAGRQEQYHVKGVLPQRRDYRSYDGSTPLFDTVIVMEGERATLQMLSDWHQGRLQPYYYGDKQDAMDLDAIPFPAWDLLPDDHIYNDGVAVMKKPYNESKLRPGKYPVMSLIGTRGCPYKCTYCFVGGTLVDMANGSRLSIESLKIGDFVLAFDRSTGYIQAQPVTAAGSREADDVYEIVLEDGTVLGVTGDHPFVTPEGWKNGASCEGSYLRRMWQGVQKGTSDVFRPMPFGSDSKGSAGQNSIARSSCEIIGSNEEAYSSTYGVAGSGKAQKSLGSATRRSLARGAYSPNGAGQSDGQPQISREDGRYGAQAISGRTKTSTATTFFTSVRWYLQQARKKALYLFHSAWPSSSSLWATRILDWPLSIWNAAQSRYATSIGEASNSVLWSALAYSGIPRTTTSGLFERQMVCDGFVGGMPSYKIQQGLGHCPGQRISGDWVRVKSVTFLGRRTVYPISVANDETFFANGIATHNCSTPWIGQRPRYRSPQNIIAEMNAVMDKGVHQFKFQDDTYTLHKTKLRELASAVHAEFGYGSFASRIHTRVNTMDDHVAESLKLMNCKVTCFGIESGSQKVLDANQKGTKVQQNTDAVKRAKEHGFYTIAFLVIGMAGETLETMRETQDWLLSMKPYLDSCNLAVGIPYPGSRWWTHPQESGIDIVDYNYDNQWIVGFSDRDEILVRPHGSTVEQMFQIKNEMFHFLVEHGWAKAEWQEDSRIRKQQEEAVANGVLTAASGLTYAGH